jgi:hypothetical protein
MLVLLAGDPFWAALLDIKGAAADSHDLSRCSNLCGGIVTLVRWKFVALWILFDT